jgi:Rab11 family-interacting protein 1/2/5
VAITKDDISINNKTPETPKKKEEKDGMLSKLKHFRKDKNEIDTKRDKPISNSSERIIIGGEKDVSYSCNNHISNELLQKFEGKSREELILLVCGLQSDLESQKKKLKDLEDYLDDLLLRVMETTPRILQNPYVTCKLSHKKLSG